MAVIASAVNTPFTPAATPFYVQVTGGTAILQARGSASEAWTAILQSIGAPGVGAAILQNPVTGVQYQFITVSGTPVVRAIQ